MQQTTLNSSIFGTTMNLYVEDRCFVPRRVCTLKVRPTALLPRPVELILPRDGPEGVTLQRGRYDVVLGAALAFGVANTRSSFATLLERGSDGLPVVNLGRGAAGPHIYTDPANWPVLAPLLTNARSVIICVFSGRSSANSESGAFSGTTFGPEQLREYDRIVALEQRGKRRQAQRLRLESLRMAREHYTELVRRIRSGPPCQRRACRDRARQQLRTTPASAATPTPRVLLVWFSSCPLRGCKWSWEFPHYYTAAEPYARSLTELHAALGAELIDASYGHLKPSTPIPVDQCSRCRPTATGDRGGVCTSVGARKDAARSGRLCGSSCRSVWDNYYPDTGHHVHAARVISEALRANPAHLPDDRYLSMVNGPASASPASMMRGRPVALAAPGLPRINLSSRIFHNHIHKTAGTVFLRYIASLPAVADCALSGVTSVDHTRPGTWDRFESWWFGRGGTFGKPAEACTLASLETPELGPMYRQLRATSNNAASSGELEPQLVSFFRHPFSRCRSHWRYEQALCHRRQLSRYPYQHKYCVEHFLPKYGAINDSATHRAFAHEYCADFMTRGLVATNGMPEGATNFLTSKLSFFGISERFLPSLCLFLFQAGRFDKAQCDCSGTGYGQPLRLASQLPEPDPREAELIRQGRRRMPSLWMRDSELMRLSAGDVEVYSQLVGELQRRIRTVEGLTGSRIWDCPGSHHGNGAT